MYWLDAVKSLVVIKRERKPISTLNNWIERLSIRKAIRKALRWKDRVDASVFWTKEFDKHCRLAFRTDVTCNLVTLQLRYIQQMLILLIFYANIEPVRAHTAKDDRELPWQCQVDTTRVLLYNRISWTTCQPQSFFVHSHWLLTSLLIPLLTLLLTPLQLLLEYIKRCKNFFTNFDPEHWKFRVQFSKFNLTELLTALICWAYARQMLFTGLHSEFARCL